MISDHTLQLLEFGKVVEKLASFCHSEAGRNSALALRPLPSPAGANAAFVLLDETASWLQSARKAGEMSGIFRDVPDINILLENSLARFVQDIDVYWTFRELLSQAKTVCETVETAQAETNWPHLLAMLKAQPYPVQSSAALVRCLSDDCIIRDESSPELYRLRGELRSLHQTCIRKVREFADRYNITAYLQDDFMTLSQDRYVLPLKADFKGRIQGIVHDWSQTGETCYFEPFFLVTVNNQLQDLKREEREEERNILQYLHDLLVDEQDAIRSLFHFLTTLDLLQAKKRLADRLAAKPVAIGGLEGGINLDQARHPLLVLDGQKAKALNIVLRSGEQALIITGGNAGGKTVCLKTLGLVAAMTYSGLPAPAAAGSFLPWFEHLEAFIGDEQDMSENLSTFTAQVGRLAKVWATLGHDSLILLDEFGAGTDPAQGAALAQAVLDGLVEKKTFALVATHFPALKAYALTNDSVRAACMLFEPESKKPLFRLAYDQVGASLALDVARECNFPASVLARAEHYLLEHGESVSQMLDHLNRLTVERENELATLKREREKVENQLRNAKAAHAREIARLRDEVQAGISRMMALHQEEKISARQAMRELSQLKKTLAGSEDPDEADDVPLVIRTGDRVLHKKLNRQGTITAVDEKRGKVQLDLDGMSIWCLNKEIATAKIERRPVAKMSQTRLNISHDTVASMQIDVRGQLAEQAVSEVEKFVDKAILAGYSELEIIHGRGSGTLRRQIHDFLAAVPSVATFSLANEERGGDGMTIVTLK